MRGNSAVSNEDKREEREDHNGRRRHGGAEREHLWRGESGIIVFGGGSGCSGRQWVKGFATMGSTRSLASGCSARASSHARGCERAALQLPDGSLGIGPRFYRQ